MSKFSKTFIALALCMNAACALAGDITIDHAWARPTVEGQQGGGGFMSVLNRSKSDDKLLSASSPAAARVELHSMTMQGDVMHMGPVSSIEVKAGEKVELKPGGLHVMFMDIAKPLQKGAKVPVTFVFEKAGKVTVDFIVQPRAPVDAAKPAVTSMADQNDPQPHKH